MKKYSIKITILTLLAFLFSGIGSTSIVPILMVSLAHSHPVFISENHHKIQLTLHHSGNHDRHEAREGVDHHHDLFDVMMGVSNNKSARHTDHTIELPDIEEKIPTNAKSLIAYNSLPLLVNTSVLSVSGQQNFEHRLPHFLPVNDPHRASHRTTILVI